MNDSSETTSIARLRARLLRFGLSSDSFRLGVLISILSMLILGYSYWGTFQSLNKEWREQSQLSQELLELRSTYYEMESHLHSYLLSGNILDRELLDQVSQQLTVQFEPFLIKARQSPIIGDDVNDLEKILTRHLKGIHAAKVLRGKLRLEVFAKTPMANAVQQDGLETFEILHRCRLRLLSQTVALSDRLTSTSETFSRLLILAGSIALFFLALSTLKVRNERKARKRSEELLRDSQRYLDLALDSGRVTAWNMQLQDNQLKWQAPKWERLGVEFRQMPKTYSEFLTLLDVAEASKWKLAMAGALFEGHKIRFEFTLNDGSDQPRHILTTGAFFQGPRPGEGVVQGTMVDITEVRQTSAKLGTMHQHVLAMSNQLHAIIEGTNDPICALNMNMEFTAFNSSYKSYFKKIIGVDVELGMSLEQSLSAADPFVRVQMINVWRRAIQDAAFKTTMEFNVEGKTLVFETSFSPLVDPEGRHMGAALIARDITERKQFENQLNEERRRAEEANEFKDRFVASVSHELRTPLNAILGFSDLLMERFAHDEKARIQIDAQRRAGKQLLGIVGDLLDLSSLQKGQSHVRKAPIVVDELLSDLRLTFENLARKKNVQLRFVIAPDVPALITSDPLRLKQIVSNLISNGLKFTNEGEVLVELSWCAPTVQPSTAKYLRFRVCDQGIGVPANLRKSIFEPFSRGTEATNQIYPGTGLGLAIAKNFAELLGGSLQLESSIEGKGSVFSFIFDPAPYQELALAAAKEYKEKRQGAIMARPYDKNSLKGERILVVEDAPDLQLLLRTILEGAGASVTCTDRMKQGVSFALNNSYDYILCDIELPDGSGADLVRALRRSKYSGRIIAQTGLTGTSVRNDLMTAGFDDVLVKPFSPEELVQLLGSNNLPARELH